MAEAGRLLHSQRFDDAVVGDLAMPFEFSSA
jgi:hypothetical protein